MEELLPGLSVSRETHDKLKAYEALLLKWQKKINLISPKTISDVWERHFLDSAQLFPLIDNPSAKILDLGSGAGFPGAVLAILGCSNVTLIERDKRKSSFLRAVSRETGVSFSVFDDDINTYQETGEIITSRALAPLSDLLTFAKRISTPETYTLFLKGTSASQEIEEARSLYKEIHVENIPSQTNSGSFVLKISNYSGL